MGLENAHDVRNINEERGKNEVEKSGKICEIVIDIDGNYCNSEVIPVHSVVKKEINGNDNSETKLNDISEVVQKARYAFNSGITRPISWRKQQLKNLLRMFEENESQILDVLQKDLARCKFESVILEIECITNELINTIICLDEWIKPEYPSKNIANILDKVAIYNEPYGVALVIGAWNYPLQLLLLPMSGAIAAGNAVIVKPSEIAEASAKFIVETLPRYLDNDAVIVVEGGPEEMTELLNQKFDYIFFTGSPLVGKIIFEAAAKQFTPVTLELGSKCPAYIDDLVDMTVTARRILWGKLINAGQTCIAPDYIICSKETQDKFIDTAREIFLEWYGENAQESPDFARIINEKHFRRLQALIEASKDKVVIGGNYDASHKFISPTVMANVNGNDKIMDDEIFGPILPIVPVESAVEAIRFINNKTNPLVVYVFSEQKKLINMFTEQTSSGTISINETILFYVVHTLPFGGVGMSGFGAYHGKSTYDTFTHKKSCFHKNFLAIGEKVASVRYPPYRPNKLVHCIVKAIKKPRGITFKYLPYFLAFAFGIAVSYGVVVLKTVEEN